MVSSSRSVTSPPPSISARRELCTFELHAIYYRSGLPFCRAFVVRNFHSEGVDFVMDFCVNFFCECLGAFCPFKRRTENPQRDPQQNSRQNPCKIQACSEKRRRRIHSAERGARLQGPFPSDPTSWLGHLPNISFLQGLLRNRSTVCKLRAL